MDRALDQSLQKTQTLIVGAGMSGLAVANFTQTDYLVLEADTEIGGYCKTVKQDGFVWDYSGHFFHFRHPEIERYLVSRMPAGEVSTVVKSSKIWIGGQFVDFPFQKNIHQLPKDDFIDCFYDLYFREQGGFTNFYEMLYAKFGRGICERFLVPYNEKLYACDLTELDHDAMGRFFPYADVEDVVRNFKNADNTSYNATFTYPRGGAIEYVNALKSEVPDDRVLLGERLVSIDAEAKVATTTKRRIAYERLVSSAPFNQLLDMVGWPYPDGLYSYNKVLVFNLGFDRKGWPEVHWVYFPERKYRFYRVGFYDNIFDTQRMSLYVEIGMKPGESADVEAERARVLADLAEAGVIDGHELVSWHSVMLDPAYVHVAGRSQAAFAENSAKLAALGIHSIGRYGGWKYCAIEDNIVEARELVEKLEGIEVALE